MKDKNAWNSYDKEELAKLEKLCKAYREFLDAGKTERECVKEIVKQVKKAGSVSYTHLTLPTIA